MHLWRALLTDFVTIEHILHQLLHADELYRAQRFRFPLHRQRFIISRALLRKTLSLYTGTPPESINFTYGPHGKPYLDTNPLRLQFNVSHSHDMAIFALTVNKEIGADIEQVENRFKEGVAKRFFTDQEFSELIELPENQRASAFYRIWSRKEALIKALGEGLYGPIKDFSISLKNEAEPILLHYDKRDYQFAIHSFQTHPDYQAAFATEIPIEEINHWQWTQSGPQAL